MPFFSNKNAWFAGLAVVAVICFLCFRPLNSPSYRIIAADGLGYYSYLPARFIYHDAELKFQWFDTVFNRHYDNRLFAKPTDNFMVTFGDRAINKYYPGQSLLQLPFFMGAHAAAQLLDYPADGFSFPYQLAMGLAAVFYALLGLFFCHQLLLRLFHNRGIALLVPLLVFFGTNLFTYSIFNGCYSHAYSFCMITLAFYTAWCFFNAPHRKLVYVLGLVFFSVMVLCIRPMNAVLLLGLFYFYKPMAWRRLFPLRETKWLLLALPLLSGGAIAYSLDSIYRQTHAFFINSYSGERFYFNHWGHVMDNLFGFQYGMLWYVPLILLSLCALFFAGRTPSLLFLIVPVLTLIVLYSCWWYWNIVTRAIVDASALLAILLGRLLVQLREKRVYKAVLAVALLCVPVFQLKAYQLRHGILDNNYTYAKYYVKHFFTLRQVNVFPVNPRTVVQQEEHFRDFENENGPEISETEAFESRRAALLNGQIEYAGTCSYTVPAFFKKEGTKKIRTAFWIRASGEINNIHLVFTFTRNDSSLAYVPFYMKGENLRMNKWDYKEFGMDLPQQVKPGNVMRLYFWNPDHKNQAGIDNVKTEFLLTDGSDEVMTK